MSYLLQNCEQLGATDRFDVRLSGGIVSERSARLMPRPGERVIDAGGALLLPGLHDHHSHLCAWAAALDSMACGPPAIDSSEQLATALARQNSRSDGGWLRGIGYHPAVAGEIDRYWLDRHLPDRPARIQHRGGRLWILNSAALHSLGLLSVAPAADLPAGIERHGGTPTGRLYDCDQWLRRQLHGALPSLHRVSRQLASYGVTGVTDTSPDNDRQRWRHFHSEQSRGHLQQSIRVMGAAHFAAPPAEPALQYGEFKVHLLESQLPPMDDLCAAIAAAHACNRSVAVHCVTRTELVFALACLDVAGTRTGDRIEHAAIAPPALLAKIADLNLRVVTQPHFIAERGDQYRRDVAPADLPWLYRLQGVIRAGIALAAGSDAPFGHADPWRAMAAAVSRATAAGTGLGRDEALSPEQALALFTSAAEAPGTAQRTLQPGAVASVVLLDRPWRQARQALSSERVQATWHRGELIYRRR